MEQFFETRIKRLRNWVIIEYLIKKNLPKDDATWEDEFFIKKHLEVSMH